MRIKQNDEKGSTEQCVATSDRSFQESKRIVSQFESNYAAIRIELCCNSNRIIS